MIDHTHSSFRCHIRRPVQTVQENLPRDSQGTVIYEMDNLGRHLILVNWDNGILVPVFPNEVEFEGGLPLPAH
jgi:hypothetical protein